MPTQLSDQRRRRRDVGASTTTTVVGSASAGAPTIDDLDVAGAELGQRSAVLADLIVGAATLDCQELPASCEQRKCQGGQPVQWSHRPSGHDREWRTSVLLSPHPGDVDGTRGRARQSSR